MGVLYVASPASAATGGTELLQQYCQIARSLGRDARIYYYDMPYEGSPVEGTFAGYDNPWVDRVVDSPDNCLLVPEVSPILLRTASSAKKAFWWESVDNFPGARLPLQPLSLRNGKHFVEKRLWAARNADWCDSSLRDALNLVQSEYAREYATDVVGVTAERVVMVGDYVDQAYAVPEVTSSGRFDRVLYNPAKGIDVTRRIMKAGPDIEWVPLRGYTHDELRELLQTSKVYIDFGNHPGKDRMPREAASAGCCVITNRRGAAANDVDVPIPGEYKFGDGFKPADVVSLIHECFDNFDERSKDFAPYREWIHGEKDRFEAEVLLSLEVLEAM